MSKERKTFCENCRKETTYNITKKKYAHVLKGKGYAFDITVAVCCECAHEILIPGILDLNAKEVDEQFRKTENLVTVEDINNLMKVYKIGKAPLSLALGFGEITITRYLNGQMPSSEYSNIIKKALESPDYMIDLLKQNRDKIGETAYKKSYTAALELKEAMDPVSKKLLNTISYIFKQVNQVTPSALQKLLYYAQGLYMNKYNKPLFPDDCLALKFGPVYKDVHDMLKKFDYDPADDGSFVILENRFSKLTKNEKETIELVSKTFGLYSGGTLATLTQEESPWIEVYEEAPLGNCEDELITKESIHNYFKETSKEFDLENEDGICQYISKQLSVIS